jgi:polysaccharide pyruvyl transferase WcaK-like protein
MKVAILTFHHTSNYGAVLQAYALWKTIRSEGHEVELIDYRPEKVEKYYWQGIQPLKIRPFRKGLRLDRDAVHKLLKYIRFRLFLSKEVTRTKRLPDKNDLKRLEHQYDLIICGSDQIWCLDSPFREFDASFFLDFIDKQSPCKKVSYAASFGSTESLEKYQETVCKLINDLDAVSVRDANSLGIVKEQCDRQASLVLDPTFLVSYENLISAPKDSEDFLLIYNHGSFTKQEESMIEMLASQMNLKIVSVGYENRIAQENFVGAGPYEWLSYFSRASYIVTNTFHGSIFSIIFRKQFTILPYQGKMQKIDDLLGRLDLTDRVLNLSNSRSTSENVQEQIANLIDYDTAAKKIENEVCQSKDYLLSCLRK